jgi:hypothetical protein
MPLSSHNLGALPRDTRTLIFVAPLTDFSKELDMMSAIEAQWHCIERTVVVEDGQKVGTKDVAMSDGGL